MHEDFDAIHGNFTMIIKDNKEGNKIIVSNLNYISIDDQMDTMNRRRKNMNVKLINENIKGNDQSHQNVDNTTDQGVDISLFVNTNTNLQSQVYRKYLIQPLYWVIFQLSKKLRYNSQTHFLLMALYML